MRCRKRRNSILSNSRPRWRLGNWQIHEAAGHVTDATGIVNNLIECDVGKAPEHEFHYRPQTKHRRAATHADKSRLADRCVDNSLVAKSFPKTFGDFVRAVVLGYFFSKDEHVLVTLNFFRQGAFQRLSVGQ